mgnify:CR=1 FL=1
MAVIATSGGIYFPTMPQDIQGNTAFGTIVLDSANESAAQILQLPRSGTISKIGFRTLTVTTGAELDIRIETLARGNPSNTLYQSSSNALQVVGDANDNTYFTVTLGSGTVIQAGSVFAVRVQMSATSAGNLNIAGLVNSFISGFPYGDNFLANAWVKSVNPSLVGGLEYSDGTYAESVGYLPVKGISSLLINTSSTPDEMGAVFSFPYPCTAIGGWARLNLDPSVTATLYDSDTTTILRSILLDSNQTVSITAEEVQIFYFPSSVNFVAGNSYRLTFVPDPAPVSLAFPISYGSSVAVMRAFSQYPRFFLTSRTNSGGWTDDPVGFPTVGLILNGFDDAAQTGGGGTTAAGVWGF